MKMRITQPLTDMLAYIGPEMRFLNRVVIANLWLFNPIFKRAFSSSGVGNALLRTTIAATMSGMS